MAFAGQTHLDLAPEEKKMILKQSKIRTISSVNMFDSEEKQKPPLRREGGKINQVSEWALSKKSK